MKKLRLREAPQNLPKVIQQVEDKARNQTRVAELPLLGLFYHSFLYTLLLFGSWVKSEITGGGEWGVGGGVVNLGPSWMVVGRNRAERRKGVPTTPYPHSAGRAVSNYPRGREKGLPFWV